MAWTIVGGPEAGPWMGRDSIGWVWELERIPRDGTFKRVLIEVSGTAMAVSPEYLPAETAEARATNGRSEVERLLESDDLPSSIVLGTTGRVTPTSAQGREPMEEGWWVRLAGEDVDLRALAHVFTERALRVLEGEGGYYLRSEELESFADAGEVRSQAAGLVRLANGAARADRPSFRPVAVDSVTLVSETGGRQHFVEMAAELRATGSLSATGTVIRDGVEVEDREASPPRPRPETWVALARDDDVVARALRLLGQADARWGDLYHLFEIVQAQVGGLMFDEGWATRAEAERFARTANSPDVIGEHARHGHQPWESPSNPMALPEAQEFVERLVTRWLSARSEQAV